MRIIAITLALIATLHAQDLAPELAPLAQAHKTGTDNLAAQRAGELTRIRQPYLSALTAADRAATRTGNVTELRAIARERALVEKGSLSGELVGDLPRSLVNVRRALLLAEASIASGFLRKQKELDADYVRRLGALEARSARNPDLIAQIASEKLRVLSSNSGQITDLTTQLNGTKWKLTEGEANEKDLAFGADGTLNGKYKTEILSRSKAKVIWHARASMTLTLGKNGTTLVDGSRVWSLVVK